jgi:hypothetical protein
MMAFDDDGNRKGQEPERGSDGGRGADDQGRNTVVNGVSAEGRSNFNQASRYNPGHERGRSYGGYVRGWQRRPYKSYRYSGLHFNGLAGRGAGKQGVGQSTAHGTGARVPVNH